MEHYANNEKNKRKVFLDKTIILEQAKNKEKKRNNMQSCSSMKKGIFLKQRNVTA